MSARLDLQLIVRVGIFITYNLLGAMYVYRPFYMTVDVLNGMRRVMLAAVAHAQSVILDMWAAFGECCICASN